MVKVKVSGLGQQDGTGSFSEPGSSHERQIQEIEQSRGRPEKSVEHEARSTSSAYRDRQGHDAPVGFTVTITSMTGEANTYRCSGNADQDALVYAGKVVQAKADTSDPDATVQIRRNGQDIGPVATVAGMIRQIG